MTTFDPRRWPIETLEALTGLSGFALATRCAIDGANPLDLVRTIDRHRANGGFTDRAADNFATGAGYHPCEIWGGWLEAAR